MGAKKKEIEKLKESKDMMAESLEKLRTDIQTLKTDSDIPRETQGSQREEM